MSLENRQSFSKGRQAGVPVPPRRVPVQVDEINRIIPRERIHVERGWIDVVQVHGVIVER